MYHLPQEELSEIEPALPPPKRPRLNRYQRALIIWLPLMACAACILASFLAQPLIPQKNIPVTGLEADPLNAPTSTPDPLVTPRPTFVPGLEYSYKADAVNRLEACGASFHDFFVLEQLVSNEPTMIRSSGWQQQASEAMDAFLRDCEPLGAMPAVPPAFKEVDQWMTLAAGEVQSTSDSFNMLISRNDANQVRVMSDHLFKFIEYIHNAEILLNRMEDKKII